MAPNPRGIPTPRSKKVRRYSELTIVPKTNPQNRPSTSILTPPSNLPKFRGGKPIFNNSFELFQQEVIKAQTRKLFDSTIPNFTQLQALPLSEYFKLNANYNFQLNGTFQENGEIFTEEFKLICKKLFLVGWLKPRKIFAIGQLQGDYKAMMYMKRWLELGLINGTQIKSCTFSSQNYGMSKLDFLKLSVIRDYRTENQRGRHEVEKMNSIKAAQLKMEARMRQNQFDEFYRNNIIKNY